MWAKYIWGKNIHTFKNQFDKRGLGEAVKTEQLTFSKLHSGATSFVFVPFPFSAYLCNGVTGLTVDCEAWPHTVTQTDRKYNGMHEQFSCLKGRVSSYYSKTAVI